MTLRKTAPRWSHEAANRQLGFQSKQPRFLSTHARWPSKTSIFSSTGRRAGCFICVAARRPGGVFVDAGGVRRTLDIVSAPFGLDAAEVHATAVPVEILDDGGTPSAVDPAAVMLEDARFPEAFRSKRLPPMRGHLAARERATAG
jgi:hypothetical protein